MLFGWKEYILLLYYIHWLKINYGMGFIHTVVGKKLKEYYSINTLIPVWVGCSISM